MIGQWVGCKHSKHRSSRSHRRDLIDRLDGFTFSPYSIAPRSRTEQSSSFKMPPQKPTRLFNFNLVKPRSPTSSAPRPRQPRPHPQSQTRPKSTTTSPPPSSRSFLSSLRSQLASLPPPLRRTLRALRIAAPLLPIGLFFSEHICQIMWVRGPSMTPCLNEEYDTFHNKSDMVLVNMWPFGGAGWPWQRQRRLERGMVVTFR